MYQMLSSSQQSSEEAFILTIFSQIKAQVDKITCKRHTDSASMHLGLKLNPSFSKAVSHPDVKIP